MAPPAEDIGYCDTFWMKPPGVRRKHLYFIITIPSQNDGWALVVNVTSDKDDVGADSACEIGPSDHLSLDHTSYLKCDSLDEANMAALSMHLRRDSSKDFSGDRKVRVDVIKKIQDALLSWPRVTKRQREMIEQTQAAS